MKQAIAIIVIALALVAFPAIAADKEAVSKAQGAAKSWLALTDLTAFSVMLTSCT